MKSSEITLTVDYVPLPPEKAAAWQAGMRKLALMFAARMEQKSSPVDGTGDGQRMNVDGIIHLPF